MHNEDIPFGDHYYFGNSNDAVLVQSPVIESLTRFLLDKDPEMKTRIEKVAEDLRKPIQRCLAKETFLRLSASDDYKSVYMSVKDGLPQVIIQRLIGTNLLPPIAFEKPNLVRSRDNLSYLNKSMAILNKAVQEHELGGQIHEEDISRLQECIKAIIDFIDKLDKGKDIVTRILGIDEDVLGAYFISDKEIHLYWLVIGLVADRLKVSVEALTAVVAAHEWAHVYTHLGADAGGQHWETGSFATASSIVVESLAQYYGGLVCESLSSKQPGCFEAYLKLLVGQPTAYRFHLGWLREASSTPLSEKANDNSDWEWISRPEWREAVRSALLVMRAGDNRQGQSLHDALGDARDRLNSDRHRLDRSSKR